MIIIFFIAVSFLILSKQVRPVFSVSGVVKRVEELDQGGAVLGEPTFRDQPAIRETELQRALNRAAVNPGLPAGYDLGYQHSIHLLWDLPLNSHWNRSLKTFCSPSHVRPRFPSRRCPLLHQVTPPLETYNRPISFFSFPGSVIRNTNSEFITGTHG